MKRAIVLALAGMFVSTIAVAQNRKVLSELTRSGVIDGTKLNVVLLNNESIDILFKGSSKDTLKAKANQGTSFYILGVTDKDVKFDNKFVVEQDGQTYAGSTINVQNFGGGNVTKGQRISGILQLEKKLDLSHAFTIKNSAGSIDFKLSDAVLKIQN